MFSEKIETVQRAHAAYSISKGIRAWPKTEIGLKVECSPRLAC